MAVMRAHDQGARLPESGLRACRRPYRRRYGSATARQPANRYKTAADLVATLRGDLSPAPVRPISSSPHHNPTPARAAPGRQAVPRILAADSPGHEPVRLTRWTVSGGRPCQRQCPDLECRQRNHAAHDRGGHCRHPPRCALSPAKHPGLDRSGWLPKAVAYL